MSRCDEWRRKLVEVDDKIRKKERERPPIIVTNDDRDLDRRLVNEIKLLEQHREVLKDKYERSMRRGGC